MKRNKFINICVYFNYMSDEHRNMKYYKCKTERILKRYYNDRINIIKEHYCKYKKRKESKFTFNFLIMDIISFIHYIEVEAYKNNMQMGEQFFGVAHSDILKWFENYVPKKFIQEKLYQLVRERILNRTTIENEFFYSINDSIFVCNNGTYFFRYSKKMELESLFIGICDICHYCNYNPSMCIFLEIMEQKLEMLSGKENKIDQLPIMCELKEKIKQREQHYFNLESYIMKLNKNKINTTELTKNEIIHYYTLLKNDDDDKNIITQIQQEIIQLLKQKNAFLFYSNELYKKYNQALLNKKFSLIDDKWGFNPLMISIINILNLGREDAKEEKIIFPGFSNYHIEKMFCRNWISNETIYENIYKLYRMNFLLRLVYDDDVRPLNTKNQYYFDLNEHRFFCLDGYYIFYYSEATSIYKVFNGLCHNHHFCERTLCNQNCVLLTHIKNLLTILNLPQNKNFFSYFENKLKQWNDDREHFDQYFSFFSEFIKTNITLINNYVKEKLQKRKIQYSFLSFEDIISELNDAELLYYGKQYYNNSIIKNENENENERKNKYIILVADLLCTIIIQKNKKKKNRENISINDEKNTQLKKKITEEQYFQLLKTIVNSSSSEKINLYKFFNIQE